MFLLRLKNYPDTSGEGKRGVTIGLRKWQKPKVRRGRGISTDDEESWNVINVRGTFLATTPCSIIEQ